MKSILLTTYDWLNVMFDGLSSGVQILESTTISENDRISLYKSFYSNYMNCIQIYRTRRNYVTKLPALLERDFIALYILEKMLFWENNRYNMRPNAKEILHTETTLMTQRCEDAFYQTLMLIGVIANKKGNLKSIESSSISTSSPGLEGSYQLFFNDSSRFNVTIKASLSCDAEGNPIIRSYMFFSLVYLPNGKMMTRNKYEDMLVDFCEFDNVNPIVPTLPKKRYRGTSKEGGNVLSVPIEDQREAA